MDGRPDDGQGRDRGLQEHDIIMNVEPRLDALASGRRREITDSSPRKFVMGRDPDALPARVHQPYR